MDKRTEDIVHREASPTSVGVKRRISSTHEYTDIAEIIKKDDGSVTLYVGPAGDESTSFLTGGRSINLHPFQVLHLAALLREAAEE